jgi:threonine/homoserine/homoserine lactone efflux protein
MADPLAFLGALYLVHLGMAALPGPSTLLITALAVGASRRAATFAAFGTATGTLVWVALTLGGAAAALAAEPRLAALLRWAGGIYLLYLGSRALLDALRPPATGDDAPRGLRPRSDLAAWWLGLATNLGNPKTFAYFLSLLAATGAPNLSPWIGVAAGAGMVAISLAWYLALTWLLSRPRVQAALGAARGWVGGATGLLMIGFGAALLLT